MHVPKEKSSMLDARSTLCHFLSYSDHESAYRFKTISSSRTLVSCDGQFMEDIFDSVNYANTIDSNSFEYSTTDAAKR